MNNETIAQALENALEVLDTEGIIRRSHPLSAGLHRFELRDVLASAVSGLRQTEDESLNACPDCYARIAVDEMRGHQMWHDHIKRQVDILAMSGR